MTSLFLILFFIEWRHLLNSHYIIEESRHYREAKHSFVELRLLDIAAVVSPYGWLQCIQVEMGNLYSLSSRLQIVHIRIGFLGILLGQGKRLHGDIISRRIDKITIESGKVKHLYGESK